MSHRAGMTGDPTAPPPRPRKPTHFRPSQYDAEGDDDDGDDDEKGEVRSNRASLKKGFATVASVAAGAMKSGVERATNAIKETNELENGSRNRARKFPFLSIESTRERSDDTKTFVEYCICIRLKSSTYQRYRRFSEFVNFHKKWSSIYKTVNIELPPKKMFVRGSDINKRIARLEQYLQEILDVSALRQDVAEFLEVDEEELKAAVKQNLAYANSASSSHASRMSLPSQSQSQSQGQVSSSHVSASTSRSSEEETFRVPRVRDPKDLPVGWSTESSTNLGTHRVSKTPTSPTAQSKAETGPPRKPPKPSSSTSKPTPSSSFSKPPMKAKGPSPVKQAPKSAATSGGAKAGAKAGAAARRPSLQGVGSLKDRMKAFQ